MSKYQKSLKLFNAKVLGIILEQNQVMSDMF